MRFAGTGASERQGNPAAIASAQVRLSENGGESVGEARTHRAARVARRCNRVVTLCSAHDATRCAAYILRDPAGAHQLLVPMSDRRPAVTSVRYRRLSLSFEERSRR